MSNNEVKIIPGSRPLFKEIVLIILDFSFIISSYLGGAFLTFSLIRSYISSNLGSLLSCLIL